MTKMLDSLKNFFRNLTDAVSTFLEKLDSHSRIVRKVDMATSRVFTGFTILAIVAWLFLLATAALGYSNWLWIPVGLVLVFLVIPLAYTIIFNQSEFSKLPGIKFGGGLISVLRNLVALASIFGLLSLMAADFQSRQVDLLWNHTWDRLWKIISGG